MTDDTSLRARKQARTRDAITSAALELFDARGYASVTIREVAHAAEVGERTLFRYFADKAELMFADDAFVASALDDALERQPPDVSAADAVRDALVQLASRWASRHEEGRRRRAVIRDNPELAARARWKQLGYEQTIADALVGRGETRARAGVLARAAVGVFDEAVDVWLDDDDPLDPGLVAQVTAMMRELSAMLNALTRDESSDRAEEGR